ncbi:SDR family NAD(P)-dependent oxidoreductase [Pseudorhodoplanes sp.]|uniref:SDR family NAD(P)-dependent oxidoreductase n=1 Tax=Pseudorhodoplanes sp. TaxID=1934341 RepID=UPI003D0E040F
MDLSNQNAIVTGGAKGIGRAISFALARAGANIALIARDAQAMSRVAAEIGKSGRQVLIAEADVSNDAEVKAAVQGAVERFGGRIDILVNVAGIAGPIETPVQDVDAAAFDEVMRVNVAGTFLPTKYVVPVMIRQKYGRIINIGSNSGTAAYPNRVGYAASKWAIRGLTRCVAQEVGPHNVTVNCINPGIVDGERMQRLCRERARTRGVEEETIRREYSSAQAIDRITSEEDVAEVAVFLASAAGKNITGQDIDIDGGWRL